MLSLEVYKTQLRPSTWAFLILSDGALEFVFVLGQNIANFGNELLSVDGDQVTLVDLCFEKCPAPFNRADLGCIGRVLVRVHKSDALAVRKVLRPP